MNLLLDTHIWLWTVLEPERVGTRTQRALDDPHNQLWLSPVSLWEALLLHDKRRIHLSGVITEWVTAATSRFREAPLTHEIVLAAQQLSRSHSDPADRFLAATAKALDLTLVTADRRLQDLPDIQVLAND